VQRFISTMMAAAFFGAASAAVASPLLDDRLPVRDVIRHVDQQNDQAPGLRAAARSIGELARSWANQGAITAQVRAYIDEVSELAADGRVTGAQALQLLYALGETGAHRGELEAAIVDEFVIPRLAAKGLEGAEPVVFSRVRVAYEHLDEALLDDLRRTSRGSLQRFRSVTLSLVVGERAYLQAFPADARTRDQAQLSIQVYNDDPRGGAVTIALVGEASSYEVNPLWAFEGAVEFELEGILAGRSCLPVRGLSFFPSETEGSSTDFFPSETEGSTNDFFPSETEGSTTDFFPSETEGSSTDLIPSDCYLDALEGIYVRR
jgi:hypothetical protein